MWAKIFNSWLLHETVGLERYWIKLLTSNMSWLIDISVWMRKIHVFSFNLFPPFSLSFSAQHQAQTVSLPPLPVSRPGSRQLATPKQREEAKQSRVPENSLRTNIRQWPLGEEDVKKNRAAEVERGSDRGGWSWTVGERQCTAQWVRRKQEYRGTRPWWRGSRKHEERSWREIRGKRRTRGHEGENKAEMI